MPARSPASPTEGNPNAMLAVATLGFMVAFWAWALLSPLGPRLAEQLQLTPTQQSLLVAVPVIVGSLGRIPVGALTDRYGARVMFPVVALMTVLPVLYLGLVADSFAEYIVGGFFLGIAGTAFAVGVPMVNAWFPPARRGLAIGIFGVGMGGTAISAFSTVKLTDAIGEAFPFLLVAAILVAYGIAAIFLVRDAPGRTAPAGSLLRRIADLSKLPVTQRAALLYALGFGGFVAFSVYLPTYLKNAYGLSQDGAAMRTAGFVVLAVVMRPVGGWLSDRMPALRVLTGCFAAVTVLAAVAAVKPPLEVPAGATFLGLAAALGAASGACFAYVAQESEPARVGGITGLVGAAGGLGGFVPPLIMGLVYSRTGAYTLGLLALAVTALAAAAWTVVLHRGHQSRAATASRS